MESILVIDDDVEMCGMLAEYEPSNLHAAYCSCWE
jgi:hypothetical protein